MTLKNKLFNAIISVHTILTITFYNFNFKKFKKYIISQVWKAKDIDLLCYCLIVCHLYDPVMRLIEDSFVFR